MPDNYLDNSLTRNQLDPIGMLHSTERFFDQCKKAEELTMNFELPKLKKVSNIVLCGMGGSAIGGDLIRSLVHKKINVPVDLVRNYELPGYVDKNTLVIGCSYSGNTEETLSALREAKKCNSQIVTITSGGKLQKLSERENWPCLLVPSGFAPRLALGYTLIPLIVLFERFELYIPQPRTMQYFYKTLKDCLKKYAFEVPYELNPAKQLATRIHGSIPIIYAGQDAFEPVAYRWKTQFNENAKVFAHHGIVPEMNHNEILAWKNPTALIKKFHSIYLIDSAYNKQTNRRFQVMSPMIDQIARDSTEIRSEGVGLFARMGSLICLGDFVSIYLAFLYKQDPYPVPEIDILKREISK
jgi:glucose/mannose-6-phosphate isomerase